MTSTPPSPAPSAPVPAPVPAARGLRPRWWAVAIVLVALAVGFAATTAWWALRREAGTRWLLSMVPGLQVVGAKGTLLGDFRAERIDIRLPRDGLVRLHGAGWDGLSIARADAPSLARIAVARLYAARVEVVPGAPDPAAPPTPAPPNDLRLPVELDVASLQVQQIDAKPLGARSLRGLQAKLHLNAQAGTLHRIDGLQLAVDTLRVDGRAQIGTVAPLSLQLQLGLAQQGTIANAQWSANARLDGPIAGPALRATLRAQAAAREGVTPPPQSLDVAATLRPFAAWPLGELSATAKALDLSALIAAAPATSLSGTANAQTEAADRPMTLRAQLTNAEPGRWNEGRLPLRRASVELRGRPDASGDIELLGLAAELGNAKTAGGTLRAQGRWTRDGWSLEALLNALQPAALDARAAPMTLAGPLRLRGSAPAAQPQTVELQGDLNGALAGRGPARNVQLKLDAGWRGDAQGDRIELRSVSANAGGARAQAKGVFTRNASTNMWQARGDATLAEFDPRPWWPGAEDSPWRAGPHRLNAQARFDLALPAAAASAPAASRTPTTPAQATARPPGIAEQIAAVRGTANATLKDSVLAGVPLGAELQLKNEAAGPAQVTLRLDAQGNRAAVDGRIATRVGANDDRWTLALDLPALDKLAPVWKLARAGAPQAALAGRVKADATLQGRWPGLITSTGQAQLDGLRVDTVSARSGQARWQLGSRLDAPIDAQVHFDAVKAGAAALDTIDLQLKGSGRAHELTLRADSNLRPPAWSEALQADARNTAAGAAKPAEPEGPGRVVLNASGGLVDGGGGVPNGWRGSVRQLELSAGAPWLASRDVGLALSWAAGPFEATVQPGRAEVLGAALRWSRVYWRGAEGERAAQIEAQAELEPLAIAPLLRKLQPDFGWGGDLAIAGKLDVRSAPNFAADIVLERSRGDLTVTDETGTRQSLGLTDLRLGLVAADGTWSFTQGLAGTTLGVAAGAVVARTTPTAVWPAPDTPIQGVLELRVANLGTWGPWVPPGWRLGGAVRVSAAIGGRFGGPEYTGEVQGQQLSVRNFVQGVNVTDGEVAVALRGASARIERFTAKAGDGTVRLEGDAVLGEQPTAQLQLIADRFRVLGRVDRRIVTSGQAQMKLTREALALDGRLVVDEGLIDVSQSDAPSLSDDVTVVRRPGAGATRGTTGAGNGETPARPGAAPAQKIAVDLRVGLGEHLRLRGRGLDTGLRGDLRITAPNGKLAVNGSVGTVEGTYQAYGQKLTIDRGELAFNGPVENPRLDIEATRPNLDIRVGVAVSGTALNPRVRLFSEPEASDMDKISWLVLGRASDGLGRTDTALLQRAALALLAGEGPGKSDQFTSAIGLDELSLRQSDGEVRETIVSLGKQLSRRWYVGYERSLSATNGTWQLIYRVAQRITLRAQSGLDNAFDAIWTWRWQ